MHETGEEASLGKVEWMEMSGRSDLWQKDSTKSVKQGLKVGSETWEDVRFGDRFPMGMTRMDTNRNEHIRESAQVKWFGDKGQEAKMRCFACVDMC